MGGVKLELQCPGIVERIKVDPEPEWSFDDILSELNSLENKLCASSMVPLSVSMTESRDVSKEDSRAMSARTFVMHLSDSEMDDTDDEVKKDQDKAVLAAKSFTCDDIYLSDSDESEDDMALESKTDLMDGRGLVEGALLELTHEYQLGVMEDIRNHISALETELMNESEKSTSALAKVENYKEARQELDKRHDTQYQRRIAEALDNHLTTIQRDHELRSQIEEKRIRSDAAYEEAKRKDKALQEEKLRQEKAKAEAEALLRAEEAQRATLEAERKAAKEAAEKEAAERLKKNSIALEKEEPFGHKRDANQGILSNEPEGSKLDNLKTLQTASEIIRASKSALNVEQIRLTKLKELDETNQALKSGSNQNLGSFERRMGRLIRQIRGEEENVSAITREITKILNDRSFPNSISIGTFAKKVVTRCESNDKDLFPTGYVIVLVTAQVPHAMDILLAELHRACIYTVPKHITYSKTAFESKEAYYKTIGFREVNGELETTADYLERLESYMKLYGALVQTEVQGVPNIHGLEEGWTWLARFLNALPANIYTAVALKAFLEVAGFGLFRKYKNQFMKMLNIISERFLNDLRGWEDLGLRPIFSGIRDYIKDKKFLEVPEGKNLARALRSHDPKF